MVLERTPQSENLIPSEIEKCEHSIVIKREKATECLRLESIKPDRIVNRKKSGEPKSKMQSSPRKVPTVGKGLDFNQPQLRKSGLYTQEPLPSRRCRMGVRQCGSGIKKLQLQELAPPPLPDPPDKNKEALVNGVSRFSGDMEERTSAIKTCKSPSTSTSETLVRYCPTPTPNTDLTTMPWEPPERCHRE